MTKAEDKPDEEKTDAEKAKTGTGGPYIDPEMTPSAAQKAAAAQGGDLEPGEVDSNAPGHETGASTGGSVADLAGRGDKSESLDPGSRREAAKEADNNG